MAALSKEAQALNGMPAPSKTVLVVDDERAICCLTGWMLEKQGYRVLRAVDGEEAIRTFQVHVGAVHLLVADIVMPRMSGPVLAQQLRVLCPTLPVLFTSGIVSAKNFEGIMGGWFLPKPYTQEVLAEKVHEVIKRSG